MYIHTNMWQRLIYIKKIFKIQMFLEVWLSNRILAQHCDRIETSHNGFHSFSQVWVAHVHNPSTQDAEVEKHHEFKASLDYL